ncbi:unnamed protein product [Dicrocoelium dendriticum]|nr:unnamed protein product [Dicrocoelium dendriticum]
MDDMMPTTKKYPPSYTAQVSEIRNVRYQMIHIQPLLYKISWDPGYLDTEMSGESGQNSLHFSRNTSKEETAIQLDSPRKYRVVWGPNQDQAINSTLWKKSPGLRPRINPIFTETKVLRNGETSILLKSLKPGKQYVVMVQTLASTPTSNSIDTLDSKEISFTSSSEGLPSSMHNMADKQSMRIGREFYLYFETPRSSPAAESLRLVQRSMNKFHGTSPIFSPVII